MLDRPGVDPVVDEGRVLQGTQRDEGHYRHQDDEPTIRERPWPAIAKASEPDTQWRSQGHGRVREYHRRPRAARPEHCRLRPPVSYCRFPAGVHPRRVRRVKCCRLARRATTGMLFFTALLVDG